MNNFVAEFLGTYIICITILLLNKYNSTFSVLQIGTFIASLATVMIFYENDADFNPAITYIYYLDGSRSYEKLMYFIFYQFCAATLAFLTIKIIF